MPTDAPSWLANWLERHQHPVSRGLHYVGIPLTLPFIPLAVAAVALGRLDVFWWGLGLGFVGYLLQFVGHVIEGNELGEVVLVKKLLGKPYCAISPRYGGRWERGRVPK
jgi:hypothetical protein